jgi:hypothetical protein
MLGGSLLLILWFNHGLLKETPEILTNFQSVRTFVRLTIKMNFSHTFFVSFLTARLTIV